MQATSDRNAMNAAGLTRFSPFMPSCHHDAIIVQSFLPFCIFCGFMTLVCLPRLISLRVD